EPKKAPRQLDHPPPHPSIAGSGEPLLPASASTFVGRARQPSVARHGAPVAQVARQDLLDQHVRRLDVGSTPTAYKDVTRMFVPPHAGSPRTSSSQPQQVCHRARTRQGRSPCGWRYAPSLTASARAGSMRSWVGTKKRLARSNKETPRKEKMDSTLG